MLVIMWLDGDVDLFVNVMVKIGIISLLGFYYIELVLLKGEVW